MQKLVQILVGAALYGAAAVPTNLPVPITVSSTPAYHFISEKDAIFLASIAPTNKKSIESIIRAGYGSEIKEWLDGSLKNYIVHFLTQENVYLARGEAAEAKLWRDRAGELFKCFYVLDSKGILEYLDYIADKAYLTEEIYQPSH